MIHRLMLSSWLSPLATLSKRGVRFVREGITATQPLNARSLQQPHHYKINGRKPTVVVRNSSPWSKKWTTIWLRKCWTGWLLMSCSAWKPKSWLVKRWESSIQRLTSSQWAVWCWQCRAWRLGISAHQGPPAEVCKAGSATPRLHGSSVGDGSSPCSQQFLDVSRPHQRLRTALRGTHVCKFLGEFHLPQTAQLAGKSPGFWENDGASWLVKSSCPVIVVSCKRAYFLVERWGLHC